MGARPSVLVWLRGQRRGGITLFVFLLLLMAAERRLAELHLNQRSAAPALESTESLEGDEVRIRLIALNDDKPPTIPGVGRTFAPRRIHIALDVPFAVALGRPAPRGPPAPSLSIA